MKSRWTVGKRIGLGFAVVVLALGIVAGWSVFGFNGIVSGLSEAIECNVLQNEIARREIDHLNWAGQLRDLLTDDHVTQLTVQTDPHKCAFGQWYYGEGRKEAEKLVPGIADTLKGIEEPHRKLHESAIAIGKAFRQADVHLPALLSEKESDHLRWIHACEKLFVENLDRLDVETDPTRCGLAKFLYGEEAKQAAAMDPELGQLIEALKAPHARLHESAREIQKHWQPCHEGLIDTLKDRLDDHRRWIAVVSRACITEAKELDVETDAAQCAFGQFLESNQVRQWCGEFPELKTALDACRQPHELLHASAKDIAGALAGGDVTGARKVFLDRAEPAMKQVDQHLQQAITAEKSVIHAQELARKAYESQTLPALTETQLALKAVKEKAIANVAGIQQANALFASQTTPFLHEVQHLLQAIAEGAEHVASEHNSGIQASARTTRAGVLLVGGIAGAVAILLAFMITRGLIKILGRIVTGLQEGAEQTTEAAEQVSSASQQLAEGASEQASSLEETASALEEMAAMTRSNAGNAEQARSIADQARTAADSGSQTMNRLSEAMTSINDSSDQISKIIKVIEEIAFQTNLLALNAAVEAARAGEHGKGFAVVADEVRNLAQRAAQAAKETTGLIEDAVTRAHEGTEVTGQARQALGKIIEDVSKVGDLITGIAQATQEQAQGAEQVNIAVSEMDKVTQSNASGAEESASAAEELNAQSQNLKHMVDELVALVGSKTRTTQKPTVKSTQPPTRTLSARRPAPKREVALAGMTPQETEGSEDLADF